MAEACYKDPYLQASFKGVTFRAIEATSEHGRRGAEGEFPFGEQTAYADLGRKIRVYTIQGRFDGNDHVQQAKRLIDACEGKGPGVLVHPTRGVISLAACRSIRVTDSMEEGQGVTTLDLEFVEANVWPNGVGFFGQLAGSALGAIIAPIRAHSLALYQPKKVPAFRASAVIQTAQDQVRNVLREYSTATANDLTGASRSRVINDLTRLSQDQRLGADAANMDKGLSLGMAAIARNLRGADKFSAFRRLANGAAKGATMPGVSGASQNAVYSLVRVTAASYMVEAVMEQGAANSADIFSQIDVIETLLLGEQDYARQTCDNGLFMAISEFKTQAMGQMLQKAYAAPGVARYNFNGSVHPLVAAYSVIGDAKRHRDLEAMNVIAANGTFAGGVLSVTR